MALAINNNLMANNVTRNLQGHYDKLGKSTQRLSSGLRVNSAADDAAGLAIRELMRADVAALNQGVRNANDGISLIQTADGALGVIDSKLIRMKELAEQASTDTYTDAQRSIINEEYQAMADEITRIAQDTDFNGKKLLNGAAHESVTAAGTAATPNANGEYTIASNGDVLAETFSSNVSLASTVATAATASLDALHADSTQVATVTNIEKLEVLQADGTWAEQTLAAGDQNGNIRVTTTDGQVVEMESETITLAAVTDGFSFTAKDGGGTATFFDTFRVSESFNVHFGSSSAGTDSYDINIGETSAKALGVGAGASDDVTTTAKAKSALDNITKAIEKKDGIRATLGATQNRLEATIENVSIQKENLQAAESRISDVDVATEMTEFSKQQILANAAVSMLSQANNLPQMAQKLIG